MTCTNRTFVFFIAALTCIGVFGCTSSSSTRTTAEEETVNNGYSKQNKSESTSATSTVTPSEQDKDYATDLSDLLRGHASGVQVSRTSGGVRVLVRGPTSFNASNSPLYVVDGVPVSTSSNGVVPVNPRDVKSITVLKDASAAGIYGSRGANGVIVIETRD